MGGADVVASVIVIVAVVALFVWYFGTESGRRSRARGARARAAKRPQPISAVGARSAAGELACPKCGGTEFVIRRRMSTKLLAGAASLLGQSKHVRCVTCGTEYLRR